MGKFTTRVEPGTGRTIKSGINTRPVSRTPKQILLAGMLCRAIVLRTYVTDATERTQTTPNTTRKYEVECDILMAKTCVFYPRVPVMQHGHGINDANIWIPKGTTRVIDGGELNFSRVSRRGTLQSLPPNIEELNGDQVIVQFIEGDLEMPIITGSLTHSKTKRLVKEGSGWSESQQGAERGTPYQDEKYFRYRGVEVRINDVGDVLIDTIGATNEEVTEAPTLTGGQVRVRVKPTEKFTIQIGTEDVLEIWQDLSGVHVDIGEGAAEHLILGDKTIEWLAGHVHYDPAYTSPLTGVPVTVPVTGIPQVEATKLALGETPGTRITSANHRVK